jgi:DNA-binding NarL/FixJ family response regulator
MKKRANLDRSQANILIVCAQGATSGQLRQALKSVGYTNITSAPSHLQGINKTRLRNFSHVIFDAKSSDMPTFDFVSQMMEMDENCAMIAVSEQPRIDDVFGLLRLGARGFIIPPFTIDILETIIHQSTEGPPLSDAVLNSPDRNAAFTSVVLNNLYRLTVAMRQAREFPTAEREVKIYNYSLRESVELAQLFCEGSDEDLRDKIIEGCLNRAKDAATRLGRLRKKLKKERVYDEDGNEITTNA